MKLSPRPSDLLRHKKDESRRGVATLYVYGFQDKGDKGLEKIELGKKDFRVLPE